MSRVIALFYNAEQRRLRALWRLLAQMGIFLLLIMAAATALRASDAADAAWSLTPPLAAILSIHLACRLLDRRPLGSLGLQVGRRWWAELVVGGLLGSAAVGAVVAALCLLGLASVQGRSAAGSAPGNTGAPLTWAIAYYVVAGLAEELLFRGYWLRNVAEGLTGSRLAPRAALAVSALICSILFALAHGGHNGLPVLAALNTFAAGLLLCLMVALTGRLALAVGFHIAWNITQGPVFGLSVSGLDDLSGGVLQTVIAPDAPALLVGGAYGPEGGLLVTASLVLVAGLLWAWQARRADRTLPDSAA